LCVGQSSVFHRGRDAQPTFVSKVPQRLWRQQPLSRPRNSMIWRLVTSKPDPGRRHRRCLRSA
jgi:hypothetical protein